MGRIQAPVPEGPTTMGFVYGLGQTMLTFDAKAAEIARTDIPVLILGASGTGKDSYARLIHRLSQKGASNFSKINCSAVGPGDLLAQVYETLGRVSDHEPPGSVYLDNIHELDLACQRVLLSHLSDGDDTHSRGDLCARLISSTTRSLESEVEAGHFRRELYFRLNGASLRLPPLTERREDIPILTDYFLNKHSNVLKKNAPSLSNKTIQALVEYHWPGNIRELENFVRKIVLFGDIQMALNELKNAWTVNNKQIENRAGASLKVAARAALKRAERELIVQALERTRWNRKRAAQELQISYKSLLYKIKEIGALNRDPQG